MKRMKEIDHHVYFVVYKKANNDFIIQTKTVCFTCSPSKDNAAELIEIIIQYINKYMTASHIFMKRLVLLTNFGLNPIICTGELLNYHVQFMLNFMLYANHLHATHDKKDNAKLIQNGYFEAPTVIYPTPPSEPNWMTYINDFFKKQYRDMCFWFHPVDFSRNQVTELTRNETSDSDYSELS